MSSNVEKKIAGHRLFYPILLVTSLCQVSAWGADPYGPYVAPQNETRTVSCEKAALTCARTQIGLPAGCMWATALAHAIGSTCKDRMVNQSAVYNECGGGTTAGVLKYCNVGTKVGPSVNYIVGNYAGSTKDPPSYDLSYECLGDGYDNDADYVSELYVTWGTISADDPTSRILNIGFRCAYSGGFAHYGSNYGENRGETNYFSHTSVVTCPIGEVPNLLLYDRYNHNQPLRKFKDLSALGLGCGVIGPGSYIDLKRSNLVGPQARTQSQNIDAPSTGCGRWDQQVIVGLDVAFYDNATPNNVSDDYVIGVSPICLTVTNA